MTWVDSNQHVITGLREFTEKFHALEHPLEHWKTSLALPFSWTSNRGIACLLIYASLEPELGKVHALQLMEKLWNFFGEKIFALSKVSFNELLIQCSTENQKSDVTDRLPGILRSLSDFFFEHRSLINWIVECESSECCVEILSQKLFRMGSVSPQRYKARLFCCLYCELNDSFKDEIEVSGTYGKFWSSDSLVPYSRNQWLMLSTIGPMVNRKKKITSLMERMDYTNRFYRYLFPKRSWMVRRAFDSFGSKMFTNHWDCQAQLKGCLQCSLQAFCPNVNMELCK